MINLGSLADFSGMAYPLSKDPKNNNWKRFAKYPFYRWSDLDYSEFMVNFVKNLEVRQFLPGEEILGTLDSVDEMYFVQRGTYDIGFEFNNIRKYRLRFGPRTIIGGFGLAFNKRTQYCYRANTEMHAFSLRKHSWYHIVESYKYFAMSIRIKFLYFYVKNISNPL